MTKHVMDTDIGHTRLDDAGNGLLGTPADRIEGPLKVTGRATYAYEHDAGPDTAYGYLVTAPVGRSHLTSVRKGEAEAMPGVLLVLTDDLPRASSQPMGEKPQMTEGRIHHHGQPVAFVVATSFEAARHAATAVTVVSETELGRYELDRLADDAPLAEDGVMPAKVERGDFAAAFEAADVKIDLDYTTPSHHSAAMEPQAAVASWDEDALTVYCSSQLVEVNTGQVAASLGIAKEKVRLISPYVGGGFGNKLGISADVILAARAAQRLVRPVKVALTRQAVFQATSRRSETRQRVRIGAQADGRITAISHDTVATNSPGNSFFEPAGMSTVFLYAGENRSIRHFLAESDLLMTASVRAPARPSACWRWKTPWTSWPRSSALIRWNCAGATSRRSTRRMAGPSPPAIWSPAWTRARGASDGTSAPKHPEAGARASG
ncbi:Xanthine dehydrogenase molybdenum-binding subunit [Methylobrevis pamukkalensis]|uniref:Xanthine dehydrogenase molybdenum-binding subunit n=1 Tax=Methylobrevis pamukkalensis TaxID=1439726 RepID=A0A1E3H6G5_9HYPH|nr:Xanthine dehydrogenase molybdenum-binding subunit [Methylobrevis pamukkalensis]